MPGCLLHDALAQESRYDTVITVRSAAFGVAYNDCATWLYGGEGGCQIANQRGCTRCRSVAKQTSPPKAPPQKDKKTFRETDWVYVCGHGFTRGFGFEGGVGGS
eukprot:6244406-Amphidinium_carterae.1